MTTTRNIIITVFVSMIANCTLSAQNNSASFASRKKTVPAIATTADSDSVKIAGLTEELRNDRVYLDWSVENNQNADKFEIERSIDGKKFVMAALVFATGKEGTDQYWFFERVKDEKATYRVKIIRTDGSISYSAVSVRKTDKTVSE